MTAAPDTTFWLGVATRMPRMPRRPTTGHRDKYGRSAGSMSRCASGRSPRRANRTREACAHRLCAPRVGPLVAAPVGHLAVLCAKVDSNPNDILSPVYSGWYSGITTYDTFSVKLPTDLADALRWIPVSAARPPLGATS